MTSSLTQPIIYLVTPGETSPHTTSASEEFVSVVELIKAAVAAEIDLIQVREKHLSGRELFELAKLAAQFTKDTETRVLINDRADIAAATGVHGVHLSTRSMPTEEVRRTCGEGFLIGVSTHSLSEAVTARVNGADLVVFGPVFETESKREFGEPVGVNRLAEVTSALAPFPVVAIGGVTPENFSQCLDAGAAGVAAIRIFKDTSSLPQVVRALRSR